VLLFERRWAQVILDSFAPPEGPGLAPRPGEVSTLGAFDKLRAGCSKPARLALRAAIWVVAFSPLWMLGRARSFPALPRSERLTLLAKLLEHRSFLVRETAFLLKTVACMGLLESEAVRKRSGYDGEATLLQLRPRSDA
jgi:hypothetical protein